MKQQIANVASASSGSDNGVSRASRRDPTMAEQQWAMAASKRDELRDVISNARVALETCALLAEAIDRGDDEATPQAYRGKTVTDIYNVAREALAQCDLVIHTNVREVKHEEAVSK